MAQLVIGEAQRLRRLPLVPAVGAQRMLHNRLSVRIHGCAQVIHLVKLRTQRGLRGWRRYLVAVSRGGGLPNGFHGESNGSREGMARIEIADPKERIRKLEAIANGVDV